MKRASWVALGALLAIGGVVVYSSLGVGAVRCEICVEFAGNRACRAVDAATEREAMAGARTNACAALASGVTNTMACERTEPASAHCGPR